METLQTHHPSEIEKGDTENVVMAALMHDLGHGPFSFLFSQGFIRKRMGIEDWSYREASKMMFDHIIDKNHFDIEEDNLDK